MKVELILQEISDMGAHQMFNEIIIMLGWKSRRSIATTRASSQPPLVLTAADFYYFLFLSRFPLCVSCTLKSNFARRELRLLYVATRGGSHKEDEKVITW
jgi:hypothetical protein